MAYEVNERDGGRLERVVPRALRMLSRPKEAGALEAAPHERAGTRLGPPGPEDEVAIARNILGARATTAPAPLAGRDPAREAAALAGELVRRANRVLAKLEAGAPAGEITLDEVFGLEAVLKARGRPALRVKGDHIEPINSEYHPGSEFWRTFLNDYESQLVEVAAATGAVVVQDNYPPDRGPWVQGTAWLVKADTVVTNRHVLFPPSPGSTRLARRIPGDSTKARFKSEFSISIDFAFDNGPKRPKLYSVVDVPFVSDPRDPIDVALIRVAPTAGQGAGPNPLALMREEFDSDYLYVMGHPGRVVEAPEDVLAVFGAPDERKRVSFGELMDEDPQRSQELLHDASTIGGYSGGCVLGFRTREVAALHYWGDPVTGNRAFKMTALLAHDVGRFLR